MLGAKRSHARTRVCVWLTVSSFIALSAALPLATPSIALAETVTFSTHGTVGGQLYGVSCTDATNCTAVGQGGNGPTYVTETNGVWSVNVIAGPAINFASISCADAKDCTAVGSFNTQLPSYSTETNGTWGPVASLPDSAGYFTGVTCTHAADCTAVGNGVPVGGDVHRQVPIYATETNGTWGPVTAMRDYPAGYQVNGVSCSDTTHCTAVGVYAGSPEVPFYITKSGAGWGPLTAVSDAGLAGGLWSVSCTDAADCTAVGFSSLGVPFYATEASGTWGSATAISGAIGGYGDLLGVSCSDAKDCVAVGGNGNPGLPIYVVETNGTWGTATEYTGGDGTLFTSVGCTSATACTAVGEESGGGVYATTVSTGGGVAVPTISAVSPYFGPAAGGTAITITGTKLSGSTVSFGATLATAVSCTATSCNATSPAGTGTVDVTATTTGGTSATSTADQFTYEPAPPPGSTSSSSAASNTAGGTATATNAGTTASGHGRGALTVAQYPSDPAAPATFTSSGEYLDVAVSPGNTFTSVAIQDCNLNGGNTLQWFNPAANSGAGAWQPVAGNPGPTYSAGPPPCASVTLDSTTSPSVSQLSGTVFGVKAPTPTTLTATPAIVEVAGLKLYLFGLNATLRTSAGPVAGQTITFKAGSTILCSAMTAVNGTASCNAVTSVLSIVVSLGYSATYPGTANYVPSSAKAALIS